MLKPLIGVLFGILMLISIVYAAGGFNSKGTIRMGIRESGAFYQQKVGNTWVTVSHDGRIEPLVPIVGAIPQYGGDR